ncbi:helix-turn-helix domain-containing protein [Gordonia sp. NPDC062954]|uniref:Helix-turn-helix domain-containing protein n=1 Tax=Gordonia aquimaris TaxID=2984863 RepID=A0A9X3D7A5_9ACTN|nr:helix-turn-helix domain-containing protein [Gordonia aquimaris]MCX2966408.1 helix-turn-helix domain-containing protein [Gordonia aquimaris]
MKSDSSGQPAGTRIDEVERAHLVDPGDTSFAIGRWAPAPDVADLIRRFWVPIWSVPPGAEAPQRVLQYPVCLVVVTAEYSRFYGVVTGLSETVLTGEGWAIGTMLTPAAGGLITGGAVSDWTDRFGDLSEPAGAAGARLTADVRAVMAPGPRDPDRQHEATDLVEAWIRGFAPVDDDGLLINAIVEFVEGDSSVTSVTQICDRFHVTERSLQRLTRRRLGLTPKWLIQRRRLQEAAERLRGADTTLAVIAAELGYADEAHLVRDFRTVTGMTPGQFAARFS